MGMQTTNANASTIGPDLIKSFGSRGMKSAHKARTVKVTPTVNANLIPKARFLIHSKYGTTGVTGAQGNITFGHNIVGRSLG
jgi:hypothetical protein